ncbi:FHIPEP family type III secretion protein [Streptomyces sp. 21So2-11]|uniref:FHIPEP family type III secretion protein n=1 Tax=Streptomyces sp. 21So2-11 TaxID=3144408 RepID=UPI00321B549C
MADSTRLPVTVSVRGPLAQRLKPGQGAEKCTQEIAARVDQVLAELGLAGSADVRTDLACGGPQPAPEDWIELRVLGRRCRYPAELLAQLAAALEGRQAESLRSPVREEWLDGGPAGDRAAVLIGALCAEAVKLRPSVLLGPGQVAASAEALHLSEVSPGWLDRVLADLLDRGIGIGEVASHGPLVQEGQQAGTHAVSESLTSALSASSLEVLVPQDIAPLLGKGDLGDDADLLGHVAASLFEGSGLLVPSFRVMSSESLPAGCFAFRLNSLLTAPTAALGPQEILVNDTSERLALLGVEARAVVNPATGGPGALVPASDAQRLEDDGLTVWTREGHVVLCLGQELRRRAGWLVHQDKVQAQLDVLEEVLPAVVGAARARIDAAELAVLLRALAADGISLGNLPPVLERIIDAGYVSPRPDSGRFLLLDDPVTAARTGPGAGPGDPAWLEVFVRTGLRREIAAQRSVNRDTLVVYLLHSEIDQLLRQQFCEETQDRVIEAVRAELALLPVTAQVPVILTDDDIRPVLGQSLACVLPRVGVVGYGDLPPDFNIQPASRIELIGRTPP